MIGVRGDTRRDTRPRRERKRGGLAPHNGESRQEQPRQRHSPIVALYWFENRLLTYWFMSEVLPTLYVLSDRTACTLGGPAYPESPRMITCVCQQGPIAHRSHLQLQGIVRAVASPLLPGTHWLEEVVEMELTLRSTFFRDAMAVSPCSFSGPEGIYLWLSRDGPGSVYRSDAMF